MPTSTITMESKVAGQDIGELCVDLNCNYAADELDATDPIENIVLQSICNRARNVRGDMRLWFDANKLGDLVQRGDDNTAAVVSWIQNHW